MKKIIALMVIVLFSTTVYSQQDLVGKWNGLLSVQDVTLRVDFNIERSDNGYTGTLDSPDQNAFGIPLTSVEFTKPDVKITLADLGIEYTGKLEEKNLIKGTFVQMGQSFEMDLKREDSKE